MVALLPAFPVTLYTSLPSTHTSARVTALPGDELNEMSFLSVWVWVCQILFFGTFLDSISRFLARLAIKSKTRLELSMKLIPSFLSLKPLPDVEKSRTLAERVSAH